MRKINIDTGVGIVHVSNIFGEVVNIILKGKSYYVIFKKDPDGACHGCPFRSDKGCRIPQPVSARMFYGTCPGGYPWHVCSELEEAVE